MSDNNNIAIYGSKISKSVVVIREAKIHNGKMYSQEVKEILQDEFNDAGIDKDKVDSITVESSFRIYEGEIPSKLKKSDVICADTKFLPNGGTEPTNVGKNFNDVTSNACAEKMRRFVAHKDNHRLYGLSVGQIEILRFLAVAEGDIMLKDLIKTFKISKSLASQSVARLVRHGFICKSRSTCDSRNIILSKTKKLELLESKIRQIEIDYFFKAIGNLPREDSIALANLLRSLQINLEKELV